MYYNPTIVVVAFSRAQALLRLLTALNDAFYRRNVKLIISIDGGGSKEVVNLSKKFEFKHGEKKVIIRDENLGLKNHILACGDLTEAEESIILLEDDIVVDKFFYLYAQDSLDHYGDSEEIAGISLYSQEFNEYAGLPFAPLLSEYDTYMMQVPSSWGQAWTFKQWDKFRNWQAMCSDIFLQDADSVPEYVKKWKSSSWKKYFALYLAEAGKYFVYPYVSLSTNVSDPGGFHNDEGSNIVQVNIASQHRRFRELNFAPLGDNEVRYDPFMENCSKTLLDFIRDSQGVRGSLCLDLYGLKSFSALQKYDYCVTSKNVRSSLCRYALDYRPHENNIIFNVLMDQRRSKLSLSKSREVISSRSKITGTTLEYWAGFNFLARKYALINLKSISKRLWSKL